MWWKELFEKGTPKPGAPPPGQSPAEDEWSTVGQGLSSDAVIETLARCVAQRGADYFTQSQRTKNLLSDMLPGESARVSALVAASEVGVVAALQKLGGAVPSPMILTREATRIAREKGIESGLATWAVGAWLEALRVGSSGTLPAGPPPASVSPHPPPTQPTRPAGVPFSLTSRPAEAPAPSVPQAPARVPFSLRRDGNG